VRRVVWNFCCTSSVELQYCVTGPGSSYQSDALSGNAQSCRIPRWSGCSQYNTHTQRSVSCSITLSVHFTHAVFCECCICVIACFMRRQTRMCMSGLPKVVLVSADTIFASACICLHYNAISTVIPFHHTVAAFTAKRNSILILVAHCLEREMVHWMCHHWMQRVIEVGIPVVSRWHWCGNAILGRSHFQRTCRVCKLRCRHFVVSQAVSFVSVKLQIGFVIQTWLALFLVIHCRCYHSVAVIFIHRWKRLDCCHYDLQRQRHISP